LFVFRCRLAAKTLRILDFTCSVRPSGLLISIPILFLSSVLVFIIVANAGDPLGDLRGATHRFPPRGHQARQHEFGLDRPAPTQYVHWVTHFVRGDFRQSLHDKVWVRCAGSGVISG